MYIYVCDILLIAFSWLYIGVCVCLCVCVSLRFMHSLSNCTLGYPIWWFTLFRFCKIRNSTILKLIAV